MELAKLLDLYRVMLTARQIDLAEQQLSQRGEAFFHLSGAGHESTAALADHLSKDDWLHCHYRSRALLIARGVTPRKFFDNTLGKDASTDRGRRMGAFFSDPKLKILSMVTPVGNNALQAVGVAAAVRERQNAPIVLCGLGDGTTQQGEFLEACAEAARDELPVLFMIEDNGLAISTRTDGRTFYSELGPTANSTEFPCERSMATTSSKRIGHWAKSFPKCEKLASPRSSSCEWNDYSVIPTQTIRISIEVELKSRPLLRSGIRWLGVGRRWWRWVQVKSS